MRGSIGLGTLIFIWSSLLLLAGCDYAPKAMAPKLSYSIHDKALANLPSAFPSLSDEEKRAPWGVEYQIGKGFAKKLDLYRAITAFERAKLLAPPNHSRISEIDYQILLSYYLGRRYKEIEQLLDTSPLAKADARFAAFHDLLIILYDCQMQLGREERACQILELLQSQSPDTYNHLLIGATLQQADLARLRRFAIPQLAPLLDTYDSRRKSPKLAGILSGIPGAGYLYVGQRQTAVTALLINGLFIWATITFFRRRLIALAILLGSFAIGWYGGGIYGASRQAVLYNERLFEEVATPLMNQHRYFPIHQIRHAF